MENGLAFFQKNESMADVVSDVSFFCHGQVFLLLHMAM